ncbi:MAG: FAD-dependent oxidoreductase [Steroidobacter sp.]
MEIAICGCGPAGLAAALLLARDGQRVRIFEQFAAPQPLGSGLILQPTGLAVLDELGLLRKLAGLGARIDRLYGRAVPSHKVVLDVRYRAMGEGWHAMGVHRAALFGVLHEAVVAHGVEIVTGKRVLRVENDGTRTALFAANDERLGSFDLIIDALGANSSLAKGRMRRTVLPYGALWTTVAWIDDGRFHNNALEQRYRRASHMAGVLPTGRRIAGGPTEAAFFWSLKRSDLASWRERGVDAWKAEVAALWPEALALLSRIDRCEQLTFAQYDHFTMARPWTGRVVHIGDAAHATSPQLGQGANMGLLDAFALQRALSASEDLPRALRRYARMRYWHVRMFQAASAIFTPFYQSDSRTLPFIRDRFTAPISRLPVANALLARLVSGMTAAPLGRTQGLSFDRVNGCYPDQASRADRN